MESWLVVENTMIFSTNDVFGNITQTLFVLCFVIDSLTFLVICGRTNLKREIGVDDVSDSDGAGAGETTDSSRCGRK